MTRAEWAEAIEIVVAISIYVYIFTLHKKVGATVNNNVLITLGAAGTAVAICGGPVTWAAAVPLGGVTVWAYWIDLKRRKLEAKREA